MRQPLADALSEGLVDAAGFLGGALIGWQLGACRTWGVDCEKRPQRGQFLPDLQAHSPAMGQKAGKKWTAEAVSQPTIPKSDRLLGRWLGFDVLAPGEWTARTLVGACRTWGVDSEKRPQRGQFLPDLRAHSPAMGQKSGKKWTAEVVSQPTIPKPDRLLGWLILLAGCGAGKWLSLRWRARRDRARAARQ